MGFLSFSFGVGLRLCTLTPVLVRQYCFDAVEGIRATLVAGNKTPNVSLDRLWHVLLPHLPSCTTHHQMYISSWCKTPLCS